MQDKNSLTRGFLNRYLIGVVCSTLAIGLFWLYSSHQEIRNETEILQKQAVERQMVQLKERVHHARDMIEHEQKQLETAMRTQIRQRTLEAYAVMENIYRNSKSDHHIDEIAEMIRNSLRAIKYNNGRGYFFATRLDGIEQLFPPNPELEGTSFLNIRDMNNKMVVQDMIKLVKEQGEGFYDYTWTKPSSQGQYQKIAYVKYFAPLDWLVGTGEYLDDLNHDLQQEMIQRIENIKFRDNGYIFAATYAGVSLSYPAKGQNMYQISDNNGMKIVQEMIKLAKSGGGYLRYVMPPLEGQRPEPKISYVTGIPGWDWYIGSGDFVADLDLQLASMLEKRKAALQYKMTAIAAVLVLFLLLGILLSRRLGQQLSASFGKFQEFFAHAADHFTPLNSDNQTFSEFRQLAESANRMLEERQRFEQAAETYRDQLQNIIDAMPSILATINSEGQTLQWNKFAVATTSIEQKNAVGKKLPILLPYLQNHLSDILETTCQRQRVFQIDLEVTQQNELRNKHISAYPLGASTAGSVVVRVDDITERKMLEKTLVQSEKMLSVGGLAAGMAHEVNNPLSAIMQTLHLLQVRLSTENPRTKLQANEAEVDIDKLDKFLLAGGIQEKIENAMLFCNRAATIVKDMLNFSREGQSDHKATDLEKLLTSTIKLLENDYDFQRYYHFRDIKIEQHIAEQMPLVFCEASKVQQVFFNLLKNGTQAMAEGNVPIEDRRFTIDLSTENEMAVIRIADSGPGMPEAVRKRIFEPFFTTKAVGSGTGLGLFVSYFIIHENHGGEILVDSVPQQGTTFTVKLPLQQKQH